LTPEERETVVSWDQTDGPITVFTHDRALMAKLKRWGFQPDRRYLNGGRVVAEEFALPKAAVLVSFRLRRPQTERQRRAALESLKRIAAAHGE